MAAPQPHRLKDLPARHLLGSGAAMCAGCGGLQALHEIYDILGSNSVFVDAAGCMTLLSIYPYTPFPGSWLYTAMASAPAGAQGVRDALDILRQQGRLQPEDELQTVVLSGDGSAGGMGLSAASAAIDRGLDFLYLCYDNEGYGNTGQQASASTPFGAKTATTRGGNPAQKKDLFALWAANRPVYAATVCGAEPLDLARKIETAKSIHGPRLILALTPCPTGWGFEPSETVEIGKLAVQTGVWPLKEYRDGRVVHSKIPHERPPVEAYLSRQARYAHWFHPQLNAAAIAEMQRRVDAYWQNVAE
jgi:pyruvate ferredoxin oxidoreductase beta subunit